MGSNTLTSRSSGAIQTDWFNDFFTALGGDLVPRLVVGSSAAPSDDTAKLGLPAYRWAEVHANELYLNGSLFDPNAVGIDSNWAIVSGATRSASGQPDFIRASGSGATATILATATNLAITANATSIVITSDISVTSLTTAPGSNNTCAVNDAALTDQESSKYTGETDNNPLTVASMGTEISNRVGQYICLKTPDGEYMFAYVESTTSLTRIYRGFFFDSSGNPVERGTLANSDTLTLMSLGWVFMDVNGSTVDVTYTTPKFQDDEPGSPATDDYWFDMSANQWKRYDGATWQSVDRVPIGLVVIDGTNCVASRSFDFTKSYNSLNEILCKRFSDTIAHSVEGRSSVSVYGTTFNFLGGPVVWDITTDLESGLTEASGTTYYLYVTETGDTVMSDQKYYNRLHDLRGLYHPYHNWRCVGIAENDGSSNLDSVTNPEQIGINVQEFTASGTWYKPPTGTVALVKMWGAGGGGGTTRGGGGAGGGYKEKLFLLSELGASETVTIGAGGASGAPGTAGGNSTFGSHLTAYGGGGGGSNSNGGGGGGGGGQTAAGSSASGQTGGAGGAPNGTTGGASALDAVVGGGGGGNGDSSSPVTGSGSAFSGAGGGGGSFGSGGAPGAPSIYGGGGGGGVGTTNGAGGVSVYGGAGGAGTVAGSQPGGGGGGGGAAGGGGKCVVYVF